MSGNNKTINNHFSSNKFLINDLIYKNKNEEKLNERF